MDIQTKSKEINQLLEKPIPGIGLLAGIAGQILWSFELSDNSEKQDQITSDLFDTLVERLANDRYEMTYCSGLAGVGCLYEYLSERGFIEEDTNELLVDFDELLHTILKGFMKNNFHDFLHGGVGVALYFVRRVEKKKELLQVLSEFLSELERASIKEEDGKLKWESVIDYETHEKGYNISLSHGMSAIVHILSKMLRIEGLDQPKIRYLLSGAVEYILAQEIDVEIQGSYFPSTSIETEQLGGKPVHKSRLAWCYGDLGVASVLYQAATALQHQKWINKAEEILLYAASKRRDLNENMVQDAGFCHGAIGIGHVFYRMWWNTKMPEFKSAADYWFDIALKMDIHEDGLAGYKAMRLPKQGGWVNEWNLLEGIVGITLALNSYSQNSEPLWDTFFLLS